MCFYPNNIVVAKTKILYTRSATMVILCSHWRMHDSMSSFELTSKQLYVTLNLTVAAGFRDYRIIHLTSEFGIALHNKKAVSEFNSGLEHGKMIEMLMNSA